MPGIIAFAVLFSGMVLIGLIWLSADTGLKKLTGGLLVAGGFAGIFFTYVLYIGHDLKGMD
jgi:hypothetical protein